MDVGPVSGISGLGHREVQAGSLGGSRARSGYLARPPRSRKGHLRWAVTLRRRSQLLPWSPFRPTLLLGCSSHPPPRIRM